MKGWKWDCEQSSADAVNVFSVRSQFPDHPAWGRGLQAGKQTKSEEDEIKEERVHNIDEIKKRIYLESKEFMGNKSGKEIAEELGMAPTSVSRYIKILKNG